jgi:methylase of polypeptide subunit release factors
MSTEQADFSTLCSHLWEAANILRGPVDAADFKTYIFPLLFFKRVSDVYDEEVERALEESDGDEAYAHFPENHRFQVPDGCHWDDARRTTENVGQALQYALREIEKANPHTLFGIFGDAPWTNKERLSDQLLTDLLEHFSELPLSLRAVTADALGNAYEYLIKQFADKANKKAGEFYTPRPVVGLMIRILAPKAGETIYDPACGTGGMLLAGVQYVRDHGGDVRTLLGRLYGQEKNLTTSAIARMNLLLHDVEDANVARGDTLREPKFLDGDELMEFDCVVANPPFSLEKWGEDKSVQKAVGALKQIKDQVPGQVARCLAFFPGVDRSVTGYEGLIAAQQCLPNDARRDEFAKAYSELHQMWEAVHPDPCLEPHRADYEWLTDVYESVKPPSGHGKLLWHALGAKTLQLIKDHIHVTGIREDLEAVILDPAMIAGLEAAKDPRKLKKLEIQIPARLRRHEGNPLFVALGERLEQLKERHE